VIGVPVAFARKSMEPALTLLPPFSRDDKRYTEKKNKSERARRKKEDTTKLRSLVDLCLRLDQRHIWYSFLD